MEKIKNVLSYDISLDIGTSSVGYAITDQDGNLLKLKGKNTWGVNLFEPGETAADTRIKRCARRRYVRRKQRIIWLQELFAGEIYKVDSNFYHKLNQGFLNSTDANPEYGRLYDFFNNLIINKEKYNKKFPTIYHLREYLQTTDEKADIRLIYLAMHHIIKYRGNFLYEKQEIEVGGAIYEVIKALLCEILKLNIDNEIVSNESDVILNKNISLLTIAQQIEKVLKNINDYRYKRDKKKKIIEILKAIPNQIFSPEELSSAILGMSFKIERLFNSEATGKESTSLANEDCLVKAEAVLDDDQLQVFEKLSKVYSAYLLSDILSSKNSENGETFSNISSAMIAKYNQYGADLKYLKDMYLKNLPYEKYSQMFKIQKNNKDESEETNKDSSKINYVTYNTNPGKKDVMKLLYKKIQTDFEVVDKTAAGKTKKSLLDEEILNRIEAEEFLVKINTKDNGAIPYQVHEAELKKIIENQKQYYPFLQNIQQKLISIVEFRIPYYVGPLTKIDKTLPLEDQQKISRFAWSHRNPENINEKIYPWNFDKVIDKDKSAELFIERMRSNCTYLIYEDVIPKCSLLYSEFMVLNEIKQISFNDKRLSVKDQMLLYTQVFEKHKKVSKATLKNWIEKEGLNYDTGNIKGFQKKDEFSSSLSTYIDFKKIFGTIDNSNYQMIEDFILWLTLFTDNQIIINRIKEKYPEIHKNKTILKDILRVRCSGWSKISKMLLTGLTVQDEHYNNKCIMDYMRESKMNFMQIITSKKLAFNKEIDNFNLQNGKTSPTLEYSLVEEIVTSPANKKGVWQTLKVIKEIEKIMGGPPANIYVEFAREEGEKTRTNSRYKKLNNIYGNIKDKESDFYKVAQQIKKENSKTLDDKMIYLYYLQNAKCLYTNKELHLETLSQECEVDHIIPRCYVKDDSFENLALVFKEQNQRKGDSLLLSDKVQKNPEVKALWANLLNAGLISKKKFDNLNKTYVTDMELNGFIARQLVETRQITKSVVQILTKYYQETENNNGSKTNIYAVKANLISNLRKKLGLYKNRDLNDYHHAFDALLAGKISKFISKVYPNLTAEFDYQSYKKYSNKAVDEEKSFAEYKSYVTQQQNTYKNSFGFIVEKFADTKIDKITGEVIWNADEEIHNLRKAYNYKDCYISKKIEIQTGAFYNETLYKSEKNKNKNQETTAGSIPIKDGKKLKLDPEKYGGYSGENQAYYMIIEYNDTNNKGEIKIDKKTNQPIKVQKIVGIPCRIYKLAENDQTVIPNYLESLYPSHRIIKKKIPKYQKIIYTDEKTGKKDELYLTSINEQNNAKQLLLDEDAQRILYYLTNYKTVKYTKIPTNSEIVKLYEIICDKMLKQYPCFEKIADKLISRKNKFSSLDIADQSRTILEILKITKASAANGNLKSIGLTDREGRLTKALNPKNIKFINSSCTGILTN